MSEEWLLLEDGDEVRVAEGSLLEPGAGRTEGGAVSEWVRPAPPGASSAHCRRGQLRLPGLFCIKYGQSGEDFPRRARLDTALETVGLGFSLSKTPASHILFVSPRL